MRYLSWDLGRVLTLALCLAGSVGACAVADDNDATSASELASSVSVTLTASSRDAQFAIQLPDGSIFGCNPCSVSFPQGFATNLHTSLRIDRTNCLQFSAWTGACAGQSEDECDLVMNSDLSVGVLWRPLFPCSMP
jgi:hypothetical protein